MLNPHSIIISGDVTIEYILIFYHILPYILPIVQPLRKPRNASALLLPAGTQGLLHCGQVLCQTLPLRWITTAPIGSLGWLATGLRFTAYKWDKPLVMTVT